MTSVERAVFEKLLNLVKASQYGTKTEIRYSEWTSDNLYSCAHCSAEEYKNHSSGCPIGLVLNEAEQIISQGPSQV